MLLIKGYEWYLLLFVCDCDYFSRAKITAVACFYLLKII